MSGCGGGGKEEGEEEEGEEGDKKGMSHQECFAATPKQKKKKQKQNLNNQKIDVFCLGATLFFSFFSFFFFLAWHCSVKLKTERKSLEHKKKGAWISN